MKPQIVDMEEERRLWRERVEAGKASIQPKHVNLDAPRAMLGGGTYHVDWRGRNIWHKFS